ncbi:hypothetical protein ACC792_37705, partial [Rhizobium ruizarguesonis]
GGFDLVAFAAILVTILFWASSFVVIRICLGPLTLDYHVAFHLIRPDDAIRSPAIEFASRFLREDGHDETTIAAFVAPGRVK